MKPNIFNIATKELSQDAFITWLLQWADIDNQQHDNLLHTCGQDFVRKLIASQYHDTVSTITKVEAGRQWKNIDVWAEINTPESNYLIIIEDKTFSSEHSDQLTTYKTSGEDYCAEHNFKLVCIYLKTGSEPERVLKAIRSKGFATFNRKDFVNFLSKYENISNHIYRDFTLRLENIEAEHNAFETMTIGNWDEPCWIGFYQLLEKEIEDVDWHYVNPPAGGGFWNACLSWVDWGGFPVCLTIEQGGLSFKICTDPEEMSFEGDFDRGVKRNQWSNIILTYANKVGLNEIIRPDRFGSGKYMTAALVRRDNWLGNSTSIIDKKATIERLKNYKEFLISCLKEQTTSIN